MHNLILHQTCMDFFHLIYLVRLHRNDVLICFKNTVIWKILTARTAPHNATDVINTKHQTSETSCKTYSWFDRLVIQCSRIGVKFTTQRRLEMKYFWNTEKPISQDLKCPIFLATESAYDKRQDPVQISKFNKALLEKFQQFSPYLDKYIAPLRWMSITGLNSSNPWPTMKR